MLYIQLHSKETHLFPSSGGSSCYLASMSSADFDDTRDFPPCGGGGGHGANLASSLSMSEADESEYLAAAVGAEHPSPPVTSARMRNEKLRFKSLFKRGTNPSSSGGAIPKQPQVNLSFYSKRRMQVA